MEKKLIELLNEDGPHYFTVRVYEALERFAEIMGLRGIQFETIDDTIYYAIHLALTFIHIKDLKIELEDFENEIKSSKEDNKVPIK